MNQLYTLFMVFSLLGSSHALTVAPPLGEQWRLRSPLATSENLNGIATNGTSTMVAVGSHGTICTATSASNWTTVNTGLAADLQAVAWSSALGRFLAVGNSSIILASYDGVIWAGSPVLIATDRFTAVTATGTNGFVIVGSSSTGAGIVVTNPYGINWNRQTVPGASAFVDVTWTGSKLLAVAANKVFSSTDNGLTWTSAALASTVPTSIKYVAASSTTVITGSKSWKSINNGPWTAMTAPSANLRLSLAGNELIGTNGNGEVWSSTDAGATWQRLLDAQKIPFSAATKLGSSYAVVGAGGVIETSPDGAQWGPSAAPTRSVAWNSQSGSSALYVGVGDGMSWTGVKSSAVGASEGDIVWTPHRLPLFVANKVIWTGSRFVAGGAAVWTSVNGVDWTTRVPAPSSASSVQTVATLGSTIYAFAYDPVKKQCFVATSADAGVTWTTFAGLTGPPGTINAPGHQLAMYSVAKASADYRIAVGQGGHYLVWAEGGVGYPSPIHWSEGVQKLTYPSEDFTSVEWSAELSRFVLGTSRGGFWAFDGSRFTKAMVWKHGAFGNWQKSHDGQGSTPVRSIKRVRGEFIAVGDGGCLWKSFNGIDWREYGAYEAGGSGTPSNLLDLIYADVSTSERVLVAAGGTSTFLSSVGSDVPAQPTITFTPDCPSIGENGDITAVTVTISERLFPGSLTIPLIISPSSKRFKTNVTSLTFADGEHTKVFVITGVDSLPVEANQDLYMTTSAFVGGDLKQVNDSYYVDNFTLATRGFVTLLDSDPLNPVSFSSTGVTVTEGLYPHVNVEVTLNHVAPGDVSVPLLFGGDEPLSGYTRPAGNVVVIKKGETSATFPIVVKNDSVANNTRSIWIRIGQPPRYASVGAYAYYQISVLDDDSVPAITTPPRDQLVSVGDTVWITASIAAGSVNGQPGPFKAQWLKNGLAIAGHPATSYTASASPVLTFSSVNLASAGEYSLLVTSPQGNTKSTVSRLAVVDMSSETFTVKAGGSLTLSAPAAGAGLRYEWRQNGYPIGGQSNSTLVLSNILASHQSFSCVISQGPVGLSSGDMSIDSVTAPPSISNPVFDAAAVGADFSFTPISTQPVGAWTITGLPLGLTYSSFTGEISGRPAKAGTYSVSIGAANAAGKSPVVKGTLIVAALPAGMLGTFVANVEPNSGVNGNLGGHVSLTVTATGAFTGSYMEGQDTQSFTGNLGGNPGHMRTADVRMPNWMGLLYLDSDLGTVTGSIAAPSSSLANVHGWRQAAATTGRSGYYTCSFDGVTSSAGFGFAAFTVASTGAVTGKVTMPNLATHTFSTAIGASGLVSVFASVRTSDSTGSALGDLMVVSHTPPLYVDNAINGIIYWYTLGGAARDLSANGGRYLAPNASQLVMNLPTPAVANKLVVTFTGADLGTGANLPNGLFSVKPGATVIAPAVNPAATILAITSATGEFWGQFIDLFGTDQTRVAEFRGILFRQGGSSVMAGRGSFTVAADPAYNARLTGSVLLTPSP